ncbi:hypothetical protein ACE1TI_03845 [Alteribacillus sp. JSM 102045]|uniref:hypothetical protein n=1 Tax=Alteribacillus sp. JSM 102045 TaxID=1562101 RepID=UPI0035BF14B6
MNVKKSAEAIVIQKDEGLNDSNPGNSGGEKPIKAPLGSDEMKVDDLFGYLTLHKKELIQQIKQGSYKPQPVKRVEIPKQDGTKRQTWSTNRAGPLCSTSDLTSHREDY